MFRWSTFLKECLSELFQGIVQIIPDHTSRLCQCSWCLRRWHSARNLAIVAHWSVRTHSHIRIHPLISVIVPFQCFPVDGTQYWADLWAKKISGNRCSSYWRNYDTHTFCKVLYSGKFSRGSIFTYRWHYKFNFTDAQGQTIICMYILFVYGLSKIFCYTVCKVQKKHTWCRECYKWVLNHPTKCIP